ncbi:MAG: GNAT family N-acetyltransferase [Rhodospirillaceae bacterium]|nr:GNAT family N-acetyltransferase [Rhodospirillaceae bacterium]MBT3925861.1 GNAT family N-acetyltransferase [Rhodospirillaceae bacterium]MBT4427594.1 GNAT family N-acetyltransferase [Rhodospirillaceae bacterium]MBT5040339.1 GNAT family N-acetyltransferase [Rhodospirillaceae bacterium]MBT5677170.1 GNAT family N-acetyltransferase [Rhodospirillaceae bacterium]
MLSWRVTYMERTVPVPETPVAPASDISFTLKPDISLEHYRDLHLKVGENWLWWERLALDDTALGKLISDPDTLIHTLRVGGELAGFAELDKSEAEAPAIRYFGLLPDFIGRRLGGFMMESLLHRVWQPPVRRVTLDTCDLDHPAAIDFYHRHQFKETRTEVQTAEDPRETGILPRTAAPHIPLNRQL